MRIAPVVTLVLASLLVLPVGEVLAAEVDPTTLARIRDAAMDSDWAHQELADLADTIGPRLT